MSDVIGDSLLSTIRKLLGAHSADTAGDAELLRRFVQQRDEPAFELLVWRHAGLVLAVCRQVLRHEQSVEDAFQATFLVLARKAASISQREALAGWLHRVAFRVAMRARRQAARYPSEVPASLDLGALPAPHRNGASEEDLRLLHEEILRLPEKYRLPVICCHLEGKTHAEAAQALGWCKGTVAGRLSRARELLRRRLSRRGLEAGAVSFALEGSIGSAGATVSARSVAGLVKSAAGLVTNESAAAGASGPVAALAEGVIQEMFRAKVKWAALVLVGLATIGLGAVLATTRPGAGEQAAARQESADERNDAEDERPAAQAKKPNDPLDEALQRARVRQQLRTIGVALRNYDATFGHLPLPAVVDRTGKPLLSWRVALLPYLEQNALYQQFKLDEAWDSPHNKKLIDRMPAIFAAVGKTPRPPETYFQYIVGPEAVFTSHRLGRYLHGIPGGTGSSGPGAAGAGSGPGMPGGTGSSGPGAAGAGSGPGMGPGFPGGLGGGKGSGFPGGPGGVPGSGVSGMGGAPPAMPGMSGGGRIRRDGLPTIPGSFPDGTSNTILVVEAGSPVVWTKPEDVPYDPKKPVPKMGGQFATVFHVLTADGKVRALSRRLDEWTLRGAITPNGGEVIDMEKVGSGSPGAVMREGVMKRLQERNAHLKAETGVLRDVLDELKQEMDELRWAVEAEQLLKFDPQAATLQKENAKLERSLREARDEARQLAIEIKRLKEELRKRQKK